MKAMSMEQAMLVFTSCGRFEGAYEMGAMKDKGTISGFCSGEGECWCMSECADLSVLREPNVKLPFAVTSGEIVSLDEII